MDGPLAACVLASLAWAATGMEFAPDAPPRLLVEIPLTPGLAGRQRPYLLLAPSLAGTLTDAELDAALRHELAHLLRRGHGRGDWGRGELDWPWKGRRWCWRGRS